MQKHLPSYEPSQRISRMRSPATALFEGQSFQDITQFLHNVHEMHWIDSHRFPTNPQVVEPWCSYMEKRYFEAKERENLAIEHEEKGNDKEEEEDVNEVSTPPLKLYLHGTPRQLNDTRRTFIAKEHAEFVSQVTQYHDGILTTNSLLTVKNYYEGKKGTMQLHFQVLRDFTAVCKYNNPLCVSALASSILGIGCLLSEAKVVFSLFVG